MKIIYLAILAVVLLGSACGGNTASTNNTNAVGNFATIDNAPIRNTNLTVSNTSNSSISTNSSNSTKPSSPARPAPQANAELLKQIEDQQRETSDIRKAANAAKSDDKPKTTGKAPAGSQQPY